MAWFTNISTRAKLVVGFGVMWLLLGVVIMVAYLGITDIAQFEKELYDVRLAKLLVLEDFRSGLNFSRAQMLELTLTRDKAERDATEKKIRTRTQQIVGAVEGLLQREPNSQGQRQLQELKAAVAEFVRGRENAIALLGQGKVDEAQQLLLSGQDERYEQIRALAADIRLKEEAAMQNRVTQDARDAQGKTQLFLLLGGLAFLLGLAMILLLNHTIARPLGLISTLAGQIAAGDLTVRISDEGRRDEVGVLTQSFREMAGSLRSSTADISEAVNRLGTSANEILAAATQVASGTAEAAAAINQTTTTVEEVRQGAQLSNKKAQDVLANAQGVAQVSQNGKKAMNETAQGMQRIRQEMEAIARTIVFLSEQGQSIGGIIATVTDLADQSNLLAVNAAIEAAKAGEQGKGFTVVAQEIKSLAEQSKQATTQVRTILNDIQKATNAAVMATEQGGKAVEAGVRQAEQASQAIVALADGTTQAAQAAAQIAASSQQQVVGMDQVGMAMENINQAGAETAASMKQMEGAAQIINDLGRNLKQLVERYTV